MAAFEHGDLKDFVSFSRKIIGVGRNYSSLLNQRGFNSYEEPVIFFKLPTSYVTKGQKTKIPKGCDECYYEAELGIVIGKTGKDIPEAEAMDHVGGYVIALDMTDATKIKAAAKVGTAWALGKGYDSSCPVGDFVPKEKISNPQDIRVWLKQNGELRQDCNTNDMVHKIPYLIHYISQFITLERGDLIVTGTPEGVQGVHPGDRLDAGIGDVSEITFFVE